MDRELAPLESGGRPMRGSQPDSFDRRGAGRNVNNTEAPSPAQTDSRPYSNHTTLGETDSNTVPARTIPRAQQQRSSHPDYSRDMHTNHAAVKGHQKRKSEGGSREESDALAGSSLASYAGPRGSSSSTPAGGGASSPTNRPKPPSRQGGGRSGAPAAGGEAMRRPSAGGGGSGGYPLPRKPSFPILPPSQRSPEQTYQTPSQVQSILSLPPSLLLRLARTPDPAEQRAIASNASMASYLSSMTLPPPSPTHLVNEISHNQLPILPVTSIGDHPAIPILLGQVFCPPAPSIAAPFAPPNQAPFQPLYASVEDWSLKVAREEVAKAKQKKNAAAAASNRPLLPTSHSYTEREVVHVAHQMQNWALTEQQKQVHEQVIQSKEDAVILATQAHVRTAIVNAANSAVSSASSTNNYDPEVANASVVVSGGAEGSIALEHAVQNLDLAPYANASKNQLDALASGYFPQLHKEAVNRLMAAADPLSTSPKLGTTTSATGAFPASEAPSDAFNHSVPEPQAQAMLVQAAAASAIAANVMAAKEMSASAGQTLQNLGVDVPHLMADRAPAQVGLVSLELPPQALAIHGPQARQQQQQVQQQQVRTSAPSPPAQKVKQQPPREVQHLFAEARATNSCSPEARDYLLSYAHTLYSQDPNDPNLLSVLHLLEDCYPDHLPTLLLTSCVYYTKGDLERSLEFNNKLLSYDPNYVEAMSNIGTTLRAMGMWKEAEEWWWRAITLRPTYWDATENLLGVLCNPATTQNRRPNTTPQPSHPRYDEALKLCNFVEEQVYRVTVDSQSPTPSRQLSRPRLLPPSVPTNHIHRLQNLFYAKGNLRLAVGDAMGSKDEYEKAIECALAVPAWVREKRMSPVPVGASVRDLVVATTVLGLVLAAFAESNGTDQTKVKEMVAYLGLGPDQSALNRLFTLTQQGGDAFVHRLLKIGGGVLPTVLLEPTMLNNLPDRLFAQTGGTLPSLFEGHATSADTMEARRTATQSTNQTTSTMLLTLAKVFQDAMAQPGSASHMTVGGVPLSQSLLLPLYYVALALYPSPSTCNNLGILLSSLNATALINGQLCTGQQLALKYYQAGLNQDPKHPHLFTNLGSLLKDLGQLPQAVQMYKKAVEFNPTFDVALANLANAIKDTGQIEESIPYYKRAVALNPSFPEAICGLVNALGGVCDWAGRGSVGPDPQVDNDGLLRPVPPHDASGEPQRSGYLGQISELVGKQLRDGQAYGIDAVKSMGGLEYWLALVSQALYNLPSSELSVSERALWTKRMNFWLDPIDRSRWSVNEGGFIIRLVERLMRRIQKRWYVDTYGANAFEAPSASQIQVQQEHYQTYRRPLLPSILPISTVPTVLPFHTFTYPVTARETRLISHRTGLRISHGTLNQPWLPPHVYPPPSPPKAGKLNIGYVSSDLGNHPLSHLMQSVFGFHDQKTFNTFVYATSPSDKSPYRLKIEQESQNFLDVSAWGTQQIVDRIVRDNIHILINLSGYTKGAKNEVFAARPAPVQMSYMGFAGTLAAGWCDYFVVDPIVCPPSLVSGDVWRFQKTLDEHQDGPSDFEGDPDPEKPVEDYVYTEKLIYLPHSYFVTDHRQAWRDDDPSIIGEHPIPEDGTLETSWAIEEDKRWRMRKELFPTLDDDMFIFANFNQLYKVDPFIFRIWLNILTRHPRSILWLLRFPAPGEAHLKHTAELWAGPEVASRVVFTDVTNKNAHIQRGRIVDLFLDTTECNAHTTLADCCWSGTPLVTFPRYTHKMCSRVGASIAVATGHGDKMIVASGEEYEKRALELSLGASYKYAPADPAALLNSVKGRKQRRGRGELSDLRKEMFLTRDESPLFDTKRWVKNVEKGYKEAWRRWVSGDEFEDATRGSELPTGSIWIEDERDGVNFEKRRKYFERRRSMEPVYSR